MATRDRTVVDKVSDWKMAFDAIKAELTPDALRVMMHELTSAVPPAGVQDMDQVRAYIDRVNAAAGVARMVFANDRNASITAAMLTQSGVSRPTVVDEE